MRLSELRFRDVVSVRDGKRLGFISDWEIDPTSGRLLGMVVPGSPRALGLLGRQPDFIIPWEKIRKIGEDVILVEVN
ncbi:MAG TPA: YlmC/YmxH family sporulation protein [Firmicutes bacterium]|nr:YlmC/YmxH family sporulation protein [Bacillota bacterium]